MEGIVIRTRKQKFALICFPSIVRDRANCGKGDYMMNNLKIFNNDEFGRIRTLVIGGEPWLVGKDVAKALVYKDTSDALKKHVEKED